MTRAGRGSPRRRASTGRHWTLRPTRRPRPTTRGAQCWFGSLSGGPFLSPPLRANDPNCDRSTPGGAGVACHVPRGGRTEEPVNRPPPSRRLPMARDDPPPRLELHLHLDADSTLAAAL